MFYVGQKVVCVDADYNPKYIATALYGVVVGGMDGLRRGGIYTVRAVGVWPGAPGITGLWLCEIARSQTTKACKRFGEAPFAAARFRPVVERKTDISIFTAMLDSAKGRVRA